MWAAGRARDQDWHFPRRICDKSLIKIDSSANVDNGLSQAKQMLPGTDYRIPLKNSKAFIGDELGTLVKAGGSLNFTTSPYVEFTVFA